MANTSCTRAAAPWLWLSRRSPMPSPASARQRRSSASSAPDSGDLATARQKRSPASAAKAGAHVVTLPPSIGGVAIDHIIKRPARLEGLDLRNDLCSERPRVTPCCRMWRDDDVLTRPQRARGVERLILEHVE